MGFALAMAIVWLSLSCGSPEPSSTPPAPLAVNVVEVTPSGEVSEEFIYYGKVQSARQSTLGFGVGGRVAEVVKDVGDRVEEAELIAAIDQGLLSENLAGVGARADSLRQQEAELQRRVRSLENQQRIADLQQQIAGLESEARTLELQLAAGRIVAPYSGVVAERRVEIGDSIAAGRPAFRVLGDGPLRMRLHVAPGFAARVATGEKAWALIRGVWSPMEVSTVSPEIDAVSHTCSISLTRVEATQKTAWIAGEAAEVRFLKPVAETGFWLPQTALVRDAEGPWGVYALVQADGVWTAERRAIDILRRTDDQVLGAGPLEAGEFVVAEGTHRLAPGQSVDPAAVRQAYRQPEAAAPSAAEATEISP